MTGDAAPPEDFSKMMKEDGIAVGLVETMDQGAQDMSAQLSKIKGSDSDTIIVTTTAVDQLTADLQAGGGARPQEADHHHRRLAESGPDHRAGAAPPPTAPCT